MSIPDPIGRDVPCISMLNFTTSERGRFSPHLATAQLMRDCHNSTNEKPLHFKLPVSSSGHFLYISPSQPPLHYMKAFLSFVLQTCLWSSIDCTCPVAIHCCFQIHPFCWQNNWLFYCFRLALHEGFNLDPEKTPQQLQGWWANRCWYLQRKPGAHSLLSCQLWSLRVSFSPGSELRSLCVLKLSRFYLECI